MRGDRARFDAQVLPHLDAAYRYARSLTRAAADAEDLVQEAMLRAFRSLAQLRSANAKAWLLTIVRNCHFSQQARRTRHSTPLPEEGSEGDRAEVDDDGGDDPESLSIRDERSAALQRALSALSIEHREVLMMRELEDLTYQEIASVLGVPVGTVMSRLARARAALRAVWLRSAAGDAE